MRSTAADLPEADITILPIDVTDHAEVREAVDSFEQDTGAIKILVNNAGMQHRAPLEDFPAGRFEQLLQTNVPQPAAAL
jgi:gluconate 5-dehydrogenase